MLVNEWFINVGRFFPLIVGPGCVMMRNDWASWDVEEALDVLHPRSKFEHETPTLNARPSIRACLHVDDAFREPLWLLLCLFSLLSKLLNWIWKSAEHPLHLYYAIEPFFCGPHCDAKFFLLAHDRNYVSTVFNFFSSSLPRLRFNSFALLRARSRFCFFTTYAPENGSIVVVISKTRDSGNV